MSCLFFFFFNDTATTEIYTLSLHDALPILHGAYSAIMQDEDGQILEAHSISAGLDYPGTGPEHAYLRDRDRKSTRLNSSHANISYAVFCLKKKKNKSTSKHSHMYNIHCELV